MENSKKSVYPQIGSVSNNENQLTEVFSDENNSGLTKREYFSGLAMQGICANLDWAKNLTDNEWDSYTHRLTSGAVEIADKLLKQLESK